MGAQPWTRSCPALCDPGPDGTSCFQCPDRPLSRAPKHTLPIRGTRGHILGQTRPAPTPGCPGAAQSTRAGSGHQVEMAAIVTQQPQKSPLLLTGVKAPPSHTHPPTEPALLPHSHFCTPPCHTSYFISDTSHSSPQSHLLLHTRLLQAPSEPLPGPLDNNTHSNSPTQLPQLFPSLPPSSAAFALLPQPAQAPLAVPS